MQFEEDRKVHGPHRSTGRNFFYCRISENEPRHPAAKKRHPGQGISIRPRSDVMARFVISTLEAKKPKRPWEVEVLSN